MEFIDEGIQIALDVKKKTGEWGRWVRFWFNSEWVENERNGMKTILIKGVSGNDFIHLIDWLEVLIQNVYVSLFSLNNFC